MPQEAAGMPFLQQVMLVTCCKASYPTRCYPLYCLHNIPDDQSSRHPACVLSLLSCNAVCHPGPKAVPLQDATRYTSHGCLVVSYHSCSRGGQSHGQSAKGTAAGGKGRGAGRGGAESWCTARHLCGKVGVKLMAFLCAPCLPCSRRMLTMLAW